MQNNDIFSCVDLTDLSDQANIDSLNTLCKKAIQLKVAAVCVWPRFVAAAKKYLTNTNIKIATVANFPEGNQPLQTVLDEIQFAIEQGADELDVVFPYTLFLADEKKSTAQFIKSCRDACKGKVLKVILESGAFSDRETLAIAATQVCAAGVDFLKTSTGKIAIGATLEAADTLLKVIRDQQGVTGLKVSGGIRTMPVALAYLELARNIMGIAWPTAKHFRIGASHLDSQ
ncbi:MAG: deoxyribose-phosphate aldolase [Gammaproteobacteria bacterium]|nr:deoxyribose-phosphate aldolase [Gammaproteobacteria bacterium]